MGPTLRRGWGLLVLLFVHEVALTHGVRIQKASSVRKEVRPSHGTADSLIEEKGIFDKIKKGVSKGISKGMALATKHPKTVAAVGAAVTAAGVAAAVKKSKKKKKVQWRYNGQQ